MIRLASTFVLVAGLAALETPTLHDVPQVPSSVNERMLTIDPPTGDLRLYRVRGGKGAHVMELQVGLNFRRDLIKLRNIYMPIDPNPLHAWDEEAPEQTAWPLVRMGHLNTQPAYGDMFELFYGRSVDEDTPSEKIQAFLSEEEFFKEVPEYGGNGQAAMSNSYILVYAPSTYTLLSYFIESDQEIELNAYRNIRPELYLRPGAGGPFPSFPSFNELKESLKRLGGGAGVLARRALAMEKALEEMEVDQALIPIAESDFHLAPLLNNRFVLMDIANKKMMLYEIPAADKVRLKSLRNMDMDLRLPSFPLPRRHIDEFAQAQVTAYMSRLKRLRIGRNSADEMVNRIVEAVAGWVRQQNFEHIRPGEEEIQVLVFRKIADELSERAAGGESGGGGKKWDVLVSRKFVAGGTGGAGERLVLDMKGQRKLLVYDLNGQGNAIELLYARSYQIDAALSTYDYWVKQQQDAAKIWARIVKNAPRKQFVGYNLRMLRYLLEIAPEYHEKAEGERRFKQTLVAHDPEAWQALIEKAMEKSEKNLERWNRVTELVGEDLLGQEEALTRAEERKRERER